VNLFSYIDEFDLKQQITDGIVKRQQHPSSPLAILNYTPKAQYTPDAWTDCTDKCRGLIYNTDTFEIVARPLVKFWNFGDQRHPETMPENLPATKPLITRKMDGSLGIGYECPENGQTMVATRGSFTSDQAQWATGYLLTDRFAFPAGYTPLFEIIYPENRIVVDYKDYAGLTLLAGVNNETGEELPYSDLVNWAFINQIQVVRQFDKPFEDCTVEDDPNEEGYVVSWPREGTHPVRVKIKYETYCKLHKIMTQTSAIGIWEMLRDRQPLDALYDCTPAEFKVWVKSVADGLISRAQDLETRTNNAFDNYGEILSRPAFASYAKFMSPLTHLLFARLDGKDLHPLIWKMIRPTGKTKPFCAEEE
jgi:RNA ligase